MPWWEQVKKVIGWARITQTNYKIDKRQMTELEVSVLLVWTKGLQLLRMWYDEETRHEATDHKKLMNAAAYLL